MTLYVIMVGISLALGIYIGAFLAWSAFIEKLDTELGHCDNADDKVNGLSSFRLWMHIYRADYYNSVGVIFSILVVSTIIAIIALYLGRL